MESQRNRNKKSFRQSFRGFTRYPQVSLPFSAQSDALYFILEYKIRFLFICIGRISGIASELVTPIIMREVIDAIAYNLYTDSFIHGLIWRYIGITLLISVVLGAVTFVTLTLWTLLENRAIRNRLHYYYLIQPPTFYDELEATSPARRCAESEGFITILGTCSGTVEAVVMCIVYLCILGTFNTTLMLIAIAPIPVDMLVRYIYGRLLIVRVTKLQKLCIGMDNHTVSLIQSIDLVRNCETAKSEQDRYDQLYNSKIYELRKELAWFGYGGNLIIQICTSIGGAFALIHLVNMDITIGDLVMLNQYYSSLGSRFSGLVSCYASYIQWFADTKASRAAYFDAVKYIPENNDKVIIGDMIRVSNPIYFEKRNVRIPKMDIQKGGHYFIIGPNGSGKSTFFDTIMKRRSLAVPRNTLFISGIDINDIRSTDSFIHCSAGRNRWFKDRTVRENITYGTHDVNEELLQKYMTMMDLSDDTISDGQIQKGILIRAALSKKNIILLDEPTSAMSPDHQDMFFSSWKDILFQDKTLIIITHAERELQNIIKF